MIMFLPPFEKYLLTPNRLLMTPFHILDNFYCFMILAENLNFLNACKETVC